MKNLIPILILGLLLIKTNLYSSPTLGGDLTYECIGEDSFMIYLTLYRDCNSINLGNATVVVKSSYGKTLGTLSLGKPSPIDITPVNDTVCTRCQTPSCSFPYGVEQYNYQGLYVFNDSNTICELIFSYQYCCRNSGITTGAGGQNFYLEARLNRCVIPQNSSPRFLNPAINIICIGQDFNYNIGALNIDKDFNGGLIDSFAYRWLYPQSASGSNIPYTTPYDYNKPIYFWGFPNTSLSFPRGCHLDKNTGDISFRPMKIEQTVIVLEVEEFRNGSSIGKVRRDIHVIVINCPNNKAPILSGPFYKEVCEGGTVSFSIMTNDYDPNDTLRISWNGAISGAVWTDNNDSVKHPTGQLSWTPPIGSASSIPYLFTVNVKDDEGPLVGQSSRAYQILVKPLPEANIMVTRMNCGLYELEAQAILGASPYYEWSRFNPEFQNIIGNKVEIKLKAATFYPIQLKMTSKTCINTFYDTIYTDTFLSAEPILDQEICIGDTLDFKIKEKFSSGPTKFEWSTSPNDTLPDLSLRFYDDLKIIYKVTDTSFCPFEDSFFVNVHQLKTDLLDSFLNCGYDTVSFDPLVLLDGSPLNSIQWYDKNHNLIGNSKKIVVADSGKYYCKLTDSLGCVIYDTFLIEKHPKVEAISNGGTICEGEELILEALNTGSQNQNVNYIWKDQDGTEYNGRILNRIYNKNTTLLLKVVEEINGLSCSDSCIVKINTIPSPHILNMPDTISKCINGLNSANFNLFDYLRCPQGWVSLTSTSGGFLSSSGEFSPKKAQIGNHVINLEANNSYGCTIIDSFIVQVNPLPTVFAGDDFEACKGDGFVKLKGFPETPKGIWKTTNGGSIIKDNLLNFYFNPIDESLKNGEIYYLVFDYINVNGCQNFDTLAISIYEPPNVNGAIQDLICENMDSFDLNDKGDPLGGVWSGLSVENNMFYPSKLGFDNYYLTYEVYNHSCIGVDTTKIRVNFSPPLNFEVVIVGNQKTILFTTSISNDSIGSWYWDFGDGITSTDPHPYHTYSDYGTFYTSLVLKYKNGCSNSVSKTITIDSNGVGLPYIENQDIEIYPNPFDDKITIHSNSILKRIEIFDVLGNLKLEQDNLFSLKFDIDLERLQNGFYFLVVIDEFGNLSSFKIIKQ